MAIDQLIKSARATGQPINLADFVTDQRWLVARPNLPAETPARMCWNCSLTLPEVESIPGKNWHVPKKMK